MKTVLIYDIIIVVIVKSTNIKFLLCCSGHVLRTGVTKKGKKSLPHGAKSYGHTSCIEDKLGSYRGKGTSIKRALEMFLVKKRDFN